MKTIVMMLSGLLFVQWVVAQYKAQDQGSSIHFTVNNFGFGVDGGFTGLQGIIDFDLQHPDAAHVDVSVDAATVNTGNSLRDSHLKNDGYFDVKEYPRIRLVSGSVTRTEKAGIFVFEGKLTIKDVTQAIRFPFCAKAVAGGLDFSGSFPIRRKDFHIGGASTISNELTVSFQVLAVK